jgi:hypothetical protein
VTIRAELFQPGLQIVRPDLFIELTTLHGLTMILGAFMPACVGFANWQIPMMIGTPAQAACVGGTMCPAGRTKRAHDGIKITNHKSAVLVQQLHNPTTARG